jgi:molybdate transport system substrate-binding protein
MLRISGSVLRQAAAALAMAMAVAAAAAQGLTVAADSSLGDAMQALSRDFERGRKGVGVKLVFGASGALLGHLGQDSTADVLASADAETVALGLQRRLLVPDLRNIFASNTLVLVVPASLTLPVHRLSDLAMPELARIAMGRESSVPAGRYAREAINAQRLWPSLQRKMVISDDVREVLDLVANAEVSAGFVFATDAAQATGRIRVVETLPTTTPIRYLANVVADSKNQDLARDFVAYLRSEPARAVLKRFGFEPP